MQKRLSAVSLSGGGASGLRFLIGDMSKPFGVMEVYSGREFTEDEIYFLVLTHYFIIEIIGRRHAEELRFIRRSWKLVEEEPLCRKQVEPST